MLPTTATIKDEVTAMPLEKFVYHSVVEYAGVKFSNDTNALGGVRAFSKPSSSPTP